MLVGMHACRGGGATPLFFFLFAFPVRFGLNAHTAPTLSLAYFPQLILNTRKTPSGLLNSPPEGILAGPISEDNFFQWEAIVAYVGGGVSVCVRVRVESVAR